MFEFGWVLLQPDPGHIEMNMLKAYVKLNWEAMIAVFNFKSMGAKQSANKSCWEQMPSKLSDFLKRTVS